ncbi:MAG: MlaD family protein [Proteobacteria bacterium]|nr:MlaD family protein [Pseudomonadota bacterium]
MTKTEIREITVGAAAFICLVLILTFSYGGRDLAASSGANEVVLIAKFNRVDGLALGGDVHIGGIKIGTVAAMTLDDQYRAVITMKIADGISLPTDTSAAIHTDGLFGSKFMVLEAGGTEENLKSGEEITYTQGAVIVSDLLDLIISEGRTAMKKRQEKTK